MKAGVYLIETLTGEQYIGSAVNFASRWRIHRYHLRHGTHHNPKLQAIANKYGIDSLGFKIILACRPEDVVFFEQRAMDAFHPALNIAPCAGSTLGYRHTESTRSRFHLRRKASVTEAGKQARRDGIARWVMSNEHRIKISKLKAKPVQCVELALNFDSALQAAQWLQQHGKPKAKSTNIAWAADGKLSSAYGFLWKRPS